MSIRGARLDGFVNIMEDCPPFDSTCRRLFETVSARSPRDSTVVYTLFSETILLIELLLTTVCQGDDASRRHDGRWNLLSFDDWWSARLTCSIDAYYPLSPFPFRTYLALSSTRKMLQDGICDTTDILNSVPPKKVFIAFLFLSIVFFGISSFITYLIMRIIVRPLFVIAFSMTTLYYHIC